jgi:hypothetical protein
MKIMLKLIPAAGLMLLGACADHDRDQVGVRGGDYYDAYYDGSYGGFHDGYWGNDGAFYYADGNHNWHRDDGNHFRHDNGGDGWSAVHGSGASRDH